MKKMPGDIIILHMCTINDNHMMYGSWDMECDGRNFLSFWTIFCTFTLLTSQKLKIKKKEKNTWEYYFTHVHQKWQSYDVWFLKHQVQWTELFVILDHFLHCYPLNNLKNQNSEKMKKLPGDIIILHKCIINDNHVM